MVVRQYPRVHQQVGQLLADLDLLKWGYGSDLGGGYSSAMGGISGGGLFHVPPTPR
jgi:hypothetical protein